MLNKLLKAVLDADLAPVVVCDLSDIIVYMNPTAVERYSKNGGAELVGKSILACHNEQANKKIKDVVAWFEKSADNNRVYTFKNVKENKDVYMIALRDESGKLIGYYEKHEYRTAETMERYKID